jgi:hypothetical protein
MESGPHLLTDTHQEALLGPRRVPPYKTRQDNTLQLSVIRPHHTEKKNYFQKFIYKLNLQSEQHFQQHGPVYQFILPHSKKSIFSNQFIDLPS